VTKLPPPNYTQAPNVLLDELLPEISSLCELKVTLVVVRHTIGWHEDESKLSLADLERRTGLSRQGAIDGVKRGIERGTIERRIEGERGAQTAFYTLNLASQRSGPGLVNDLDQDQSTILTSSGQESGPGPTTRAQEALERNQGKKEKTGGKKEDARWDRFMADLRQVTPGLTFEQWFQPLELVEHAGDTLVVQAPDERAAFIRERHIPVLIEAAKGAYGPAVEIELLMSETERHRQAQRQLADRRPPRRRRAAG
jgi:hypothetical protein